jgi:hypothetical protein
MNEDTIVLNDPERLMAEAPFWKLTPIDPVYRMIFVGAKKLAENPDASEYQTDW